MLRTVIRTLKWWKFTLRFAEWNLFASLGNPLKHNITLTKLPGEKRKPQTPILHVSSQIYEYNFQTNLQTNLGTIPKQEGIQTRRQPTACCYTKKKKKMAVISKWLSITMLTTRQEGIPTMGPWILVMLCSWPFTNILVSLRFGKFSYLLTFPNNRNDFNFE